MVSLEDLKQGASVRRIAPGGEIVTFERVRWAGSAAVDLIYKDASGAVDNQLLLRDDEPTAAQSQMFEMAGPDDPA